MYTSKSCTKRGEEFDISLYNEHKYIQLLNTEILPEPLYFTGSLYYHVLNNAIIGCDSKRKKMVMIHMSKTASKFTYRKLRSTVSRYFRALGEYMTYFIIETFNNLNPKLMDMAAHFVGDVLVPGTDPCRVTRSSHIGVTVFGDMAVTYCPLWAQGATGKISRYNLNRKKKGHKLYLKDGTLLFAEKGFAYRVWIPSGILLIVHLETTVDPITLKASISFSLKTKLCGLVPHQHVRAKGLQFRLVSAVIWDNVLQKVIVIAQTQKRYQGTKTTFLGIDMKDGLLDIRSGFENLHGLDIPLGSKYIIFFDKLSGNMHYIPFHKKGRRGRDMYFQNIEVYQRIYNKTTPYA
ncbi:uncharacterized protein LOC135501615 [Lineus longissimus]|uniref:uncharacterized protein LOC135501615 n=1 Tax=Lineus longissimus TaxID=88925 RepID=UPI00315C7F51